MDLMTIAGSEVALANAKMLRVAVLIAMRNCSESEYLRLREMQAALDALLGRLQEWVGAWKASRERQRARGNGPHAR